MKHNGNDKNIGNYYIGLDIGTDSVGWAATDSKYNLLRLRGKDAWGIRLFEEGSTSETRRLNRTNRRRLQRKKWRLTLLKELFSEEIAKVDAGFYQRMSESSRTIEDKNSGVKYSLFADRDFTDKDYFKQYPTVYHLRKELIYNKNPHDVRLVYLAVEHIIKSRGHFLYSLNFDEDMNFKDLFNEYVSLVKDRFEIQLTASDVELIKSILGDRQIGKKDKLTKLKQCIDYSGYIGIDIKTGKSVWENLLKLLAGSAVEVNKLFYDVKFEDKISVCVSDDDDKIAQICDLLGDDADIICAAKSVYDRSMLDSITNSFSTLSDYKISQFKEHKNDIATLKEYVKLVLRDKALAREIFDAQSPESIKSDKVLGEENGTKKSIVANYAAYSRYKKGDVNGGVSQEDFCKFLKSKLGVLPLDADVKYQNMMNKIENGTFAPKLRTSENGVLPNSLHKKELKEILENASGYLPFLNETDESGLSVADKILAIFDYKLPYYVGPLKGGWAVRVQGREKEKIMPWNINQIIDHTTSSEEFINRMNAVCTYTGDDILPADSLLYSEFCVLNEINNIKVNGKSIDVETKQRIYDELFAKNRKRVTKKSVFQFLKSEGCVSDGDIIGGIDDVVKSGLRSYHDLKSIIEKTSFSVVEDIIRHIVLLGNDKNMLRNWIKSNTSLSEDDIKLICRLKYKEWGRLSDTFLTKIYDIDRINGTGEVVSIIDMLRNTNENLMKLLSDRYEFINKAADYKSKKCGVCQTPRKMVDELYVSPKIRRAIWQALRITDEIVDINKCAPQKIFIEVARDKADESKKGKRTSARKDQLRNLYKQCEMQGKELIQLIDKNRFDDLKRSLENESDSNLMSKRLFLYYRQFGKCMYTGQPIEISELHNKNMYDIDHIFPRSKIKDDSFDNIVLVKSKLNREKTDIYPIDEKIRNSMYTFWKHLLDIDSISQKKFERLTRNTPLTEDELADFINRQIVETRQSTKALAEILSCIYGKRRIVYSKAENVSDFRDNFNMLKCRDINDLHHAHDAYLNIVVGNYFDTRFTDAFRRNIVNESYNLKTEKLYSYNVKGAWESGENGTVATVKKVMSKTSVLYTRMPNEVRGQLFDVQPLKKKTGLVPLKKGEDTAIYGGYNSPKGAYWALVERKKIQKKSIKITRSLESVLIMDKIEYEKDPQAFAQTHWLDKDDEIKVIIKKIMKHSLFEFDGIRMHITGRTGGNIICIQANQMYVPYDISVMFRKISKYADRCQKARKTLDAYESDGVDINTCVYLYDFIIGKLKQRTYSIIPAVCRRMEEYREKFTECDDPWIRCKTLLQCLNVLRCNAVVASLKYIGGPASIGAIRPSKSISGAFTSAYLINQSATGLYEIKINLLH